MLTPDFQTFKRLAKKGNLVAVSKSIPADLETPVSSFLKLAAKEKHAFLLESAEQEEKIGRYSIIGFKPEAIFTSEKGKISITRNGKKSRIRTNEDLIGLIDKAFSTYKLANPESLPGFCGGFIGYLSYEQVQNFESIHLSAKKGRGIPDGIFYLAADLLIFDHFRKTLTFLMILNVQKKQNVSRLYKRADQRIQEHILRLNRTLKVSRTQPAKTRIPIPKKPLKAR